MKNIIATIPKGRFKTWELAERVALKCDGETVRGEDEVWYWTISMPRLPKKSLIGSVCYMVYDWQIRGYFHIVDVDSPENFEWHNARKQTEGHVIVMVNWVGVAGLPEMKGFQGWRYTTLRP